MGAYAITLQESFVDKTARQAGTICMVAVTFVLLIACAIVANLLLVRTSRRERELAVRAALGGSPGRLARQMLSEALLLSAGVNPKVVQVRLGHASVTLTLQTYSHFLPNIQKDVAQTLGKLLG